MRGKSPPPLSPGGVGVLLQIPGGGSSRRGGEGGPGVSAGNLGVGGGAEAPFTVKMGPLFGDDAFISGIVADFLRLIDVNAGGFRLKKGQGMLHSSSETRWSIL